MIKFKKNCFIFDLDGTLVDTQTKFHATAECAMLKQYCHIDINPEEISAHFAGFSTKKVFQELAPEFNVEILINGKWNYMNKIAKELGIDYLPHMYELISSLSKYRIPISIGSASPHTWINTCLREAKNIDRPPMDRFFRDCIVSGHDCQNHKPAPDVFLLAREKMFLQRQEKQNEFQTFVIGDGRADVLAGLAMTDANILYLSPTNTEFDQNPMVKRFASTEKLSAYVIQYLICD